MVIFLFLSLIQYSKACCKTMRQGNVFLMRLLNDRKDGCADSIRRNP
jgi:hypothetical protein